jgi:hypothetical protein
VSQETTNRSFDELASGLASGSISRSKALRLMGAALVGARWPPSASVRPLRTLRAVSAMGSTVREARSAVAATALMAHVQLVHRVESRSATAPAHGSALVMLGVLRLIASVEAPSKDASALR